MRFTHWHIVISFRCLSLVPCPSPPHVLSIFGDRQAVAAVVQRVIALVAELREEEEKEEEGAEEVED